MATPVPPPSTSPLGGQKGTLALVIATVVCTASVTGFSIFLVRFIRKTESNRLETRDQWLRDVYYHRLAFLFNLEQRVLKLRERKKATEQAPQEGQEDQHKEKQQEEPPQEGQQENESEFAETSASLENCINSVARARSLFVSSKLPWGTAAYRQARASACKDVDELKLGVEEKQVRLSVEEETLIQDIRKLKGKNLGQPGTSADNEAGR